MHSIDLLSRCINWICGRLRDRNLTSEEEIERLAIRFLLRENPALCTPYEPEELSTEEFLTSVKRALFEEPVSLSCFFPDVIERDEGTLHARHGKRRDPLAVREMLEARRVLDSHHIVRSILSKFFGVEGKESGVLLKFDRGITYTAFVSLVRELPEDLAYHASLPKPHVVVLLTEKTPLPFVAFFKRYSEEVRRSGILVWVADVERECIDPFIGYPPERELIGKFRNPQLATKIESLWRVNVREPF